MKKEFLLKKIILISALFLLFVFVGLVFSVWGEKRNVFFIDNKKVSADAGYDLEGWGWSDTIGWMSFNCSNMGICDTSNYKILLDSNKEFSGYAWSDNIGWISFNESDLSGCPSGTCKSWLNESNNLMGWAKALAGSGESDGWDGWISLSCENDLSCSTSDYKISLGTDGLFDGYAWGSFVVGWIDFSPSIGEGVNIDVSEPTASIRADDDTLEPGLFTNIHWSSTNADKCLGVCTTDGCIFDPAGSPSGDHETVELSEDTTYRVECSNIFGGSANDSIKITVFDPEITLNASPEIIRVGESTIITWSTQYVDSCNLLNPEGLVVGSGTDNPGIEQSPTGISVYRLNCSIEGGSSVEESVEIIVLPSWKEI